MKEDSDSGSFKSASIRSETKAKFDTLLKVALKKQTPKKKSHEFNKSTQNLISSDNEQLDIEMQNVPATSQDSKLKKNKVILDKFLNDSSCATEKLNTSVTEIKETTSIRKAKKNKEKQFTNSCSSSNNSGTYNIVSPKVLKRDKEYEEQHSDSTGTYTIEKKQTVVADVLVHRNATGDQNSYSSDVDKCVAHLQQIQENDHKKAADKEVQLKDNTKYESEVKPKPKKRSKVVKRRKDSTEEVYQSKPNKNVEISSPQVLGKGRGQVSSTQLGITVHKLDRLELNSLVIHPLVNVHIVDVVTGNYLKKMDSQQSKETGSIQYVSPVLTDICNLIEKRSLIPEWNQTLIINESFDYIMQNVNNIIIFFEVVDFITLSETLHHKGHASVGWYKIGWAFLKLCGKNNEPNINRKLRLQLYKPHKLLDENLQHCDVFDWWQNQKMIKYPSSLYVTIKSVNILEHDSETHSANVSEEKDETLSVDAHLTEKNEFPRTEYQFYELPNKCIAELDSFNEGALIIKFSNKGSYLAVAVVIDDVYSIVIYFVETFEEFCRLPVHQKFIYSLCWSPDDTIIASASADETVVICSVNKNVLLQMLPHPSFVYSVKFSSENVIATGCYDKIIRIWCKNLNTSNFELNQELENHKGYITSVCFNKSGNLLYSSDSVGIVLEWSRKSTAWCMEREIKLIDLKGIVINQILLLQKEKKMVIHGRDSLLRILDLRTITAIHRLHGAKNTSFQTMCCLSPCGNYVSCGSENGSVHIWNVYNGNTVATYSPYKFDSETLPVHGVNFHPVDNTIAFSHYGKNIPIYIYKYDATAKNSDCVNISKEQRTTGSRQKTKSFVSRNENCVQNKITFEDILHKIDQILLPEMRNYDLDYDTD